MRLPVHNNGVNDAPHLGYLKKIITDYGELATVVRARRTLDETIVFTMGSWDMLHVGHVRYLTRAAGRGDVLVVGVDSDKAIKIYKGPDRPIIEEAKRIEMVSFLACVDYVTPILDIDLDSTETAPGKFEYNWNPTRLLRALQPDFFVAVEGSYPDEQIKALQKWCGEVVVLPRQASDISTTEILQKLGHEGGGIK